MKSKGWRKKYKDAIPYLFFGVCTTVVNVVVFWLLAHWINIRTMLSTIIAWIAAVVFAYITNRKWVFKSDAKGIGEICREIFAFFSCRFMTGMVDWFTMWILVDIVGFNDMIIKCTANIIVIILNYIASKWMIFRKRSMDKG